IELSRVHRLDVTNIVRHFSEMRQYLRKFRPGLAMFREFEARTEDGGVRAYESVPLSADNRRRKRFPFQLRQFRFVVEQIQLARRARHEKVNDPFSFGCEMRFARPERIRR